MTLTTRPNQPEDFPPLQPGGKPMPSPAELPVEPDLGPVTPLAHPEDPGVARPAL
jgi:hypothetical protein